MINTTVKIDGWMITHASGARLAEIRNPQGILIDAVEPVAWDWQPVEGGMSRATREATNADLSMALSDYLGAF